LPSAVPHRGCPEIASLAKLTGHRALADAMSRAAIEEMHWQVGDLVLDFSAKTR
jgi:hypothetical protein